MTNNKTCIYLDEVNDDNINEILNNIASAEWDINIFNNSKWWDVNLFDAISYTINEEYKRITMVGLFMASAGADLFLDFKWNRLSNSNSEMILHNCAINNPVFINSDWKLTIRCDDNISAERLNNLKLNKYDFLTKEEQDLINNWKDILINSDRIETIINDWL